MADKKDAKEDMSEDELDQIIQDMSKDEGEASAKPALEAVQGKKKSASSQQALTLEMNGVINLKLCFKDGDRVIEVVCSEEALVCRMADGTEFRIPTGIAKVRKAA
ncbi:MAG TPA: hypothetical protein VIH99_10030 [Bdellovibrionota bacterium]|jgi:hypothetical protein